MKVGVLGANGFIGSRIVEMFHLGSLADVRPIVRSVSSLARSSRFALDGRVANGFDTAALRNAFEGCDVIVHAIAGDRRTILGTLAPTYDAAQAARVQRLIYLSSASVHGQAPPPGTHDDTPLSARQSVPYNNSKVRAERKLRRLRDKGDVEVVVLRPGIVFGPRSYWTAGLADELLTGQAYLVDGGHGICNSIYVDNLVHAIHLAMTAESADGQAFLVGDRETVTWREFYRPVVEALGMDLTQVPSVDFRSHSLTWNERLRGSEWVRAVHLCLPAPLRHALRMGYTTWRTGQPSSRSPWTRPAPPAPVVTAERALLHRCRYKPPWTKAKAALGYEPVTTFEEACCRSVAWLAFAGYPVVRACPSRPHPFSSPSITLAPAEPSRKEIRSAIRCTDKKASKKH